MNKLTTEVITDNQQDKLEIKRDDTRFALIHTNGNYGFQAIILNPKEAAKVMDFIGKYL